MSLFFIDIEVRYPNTEFISFGAFFIKYLPKPIIVNGRSKSIINIKIQNPIVNLLYYNFRFLSFKNWNLSFLYFLATEVLHVYFKHLHSLSCMGNFLIN